MDRLTLSRIDEDLESHEVAALCFLCRDVVNRKHLEGIKDAKGLFLRLEEKGLLENNVFLYQLLHTINRMDLLSLLETDSRRPEETDSNPILSDYRVMLYNIYVNLIQGHLDKMKFLLGCNKQLTRIQLENCSTTLDVFAEMEKTGLLSNTNLDQLNTLLMELDQQLALTVQRYMEGVNQRRQPALSSHVSMDAQRLNNSPQSIPAVMSLSETQSGKREGFHSNAELNTVSEASSLHDQGDYYSLTHKPRGVCMIINNHTFLGIEMKNRDGTQQDAEALQSVFGLLGFRVIIHNDLTAGAMRRELQNLGTRDFSYDDVLVVCVLSHGEKEIVYGTDEKEVTLRELTQPFKSFKAPTMAGKPKLFFIQACQGSGYQKGSLPCPPRPRVEEDQQSRLEEDAGRVYGETVPWDADFLLGMATVPECKSFRNTSTGSIYIQELCRQLRASAESSEKDDILTVLTRVNREVSKREYLRHKQMPEPKYTLTKKLVLKYV